MATFNKDLGPVTAYAYAKEGGYTGTLSEFETDLANSANIANTIDEKISGKADVADIPTKTTDLTNDSGFITNTVNNLVNYYTKTQTYTQEEVDALIAAVKNGRFISVATLPTTDIDTKAIYLVPSADPQISNTKDEYINIDGTSAGWELIGSTAIDLSDYVTDAELTTALADYITTADLTILLSGKQDTISDLATIRSGASAGATAYQKPSTGIPKTDLASAVQTSLGKADSAIQDISGKADKVSSATNNNFAALDANGNLKDSGHKHSDYLTQHQDISGKADKVSGATSGNVATLDANGNLVDSGKTLGKSVPSNAVFTDTNTKVTQTNSTGDANFRLILSGNANDTTETVTTVKSTNFTANPSTGRLTTPKLKVSKSVNSLVTGTGTAGSDKGSGVSPRYYPAKWTFNLGGNPTDGDIITIKIPVAGGTYSEWLSTDNGTTYHPIALNGKSRITSQYAVNTYLTLIYESSGVCTTYALAGADSTADVTGTWRVINYYDSNTTYSSMSQTEATTGTATTGRLMTAKVLNDTVSNKISGKADKVTSATNGNFAGLDANGNLTDSGKKASDFITSHQTIKQDGVTGATANRYGECTTQASVNDKYVAITDGTFSLEAGAKVTVKFRYTNTATAPRLKVGNTLAEDIYYRGVRVGSSAPAGVLNGVIDFVYDGTNYNIVGTFVNTTYESKAAASGGTALSLVTTGEKYTWNNKMNLVAINPNAATINAYPDGTIWIEE